AKRGHHTVILKLSPSHIDSVPVSPRSHRAPRAGHPRLGCAPAITGRIVLLNDVGVRSNADESSAGPSADHIDLAADHTHTGVIRRGGIGVPRRQVLVA